MPRALAGCLRGFRRKAPLRSVVEKLNESVYKCGPLREHHLSPRPQARRGRADVCRRLCGLIMSDLPSRLRCRISAASTLPRREYKPQPLKRSPSELNGVSATSVAKATGELAVVRAGLSPAGRLCWEPVLTTCPCRPLNTLRP